MHTGKQKNEEGADPSDSMEVPLGCTVMMMMVMLCNHHMHAQLPHTKSGGCLPLLPCLSAFLCFTDNGAVGFTVFTRARPIDALFRERCTISGVLPHGSGQVRQTPCSDRLISSA